MKTRLLFPNKWRFGGFIFLLLAAMVMLINYSKSGDLLAETGLNNVFLSAPTPLKINIMLNDSIYLSIIIGLLLIGFAKEKIEDEQLVQLRLDSLQWAIYVNYAIFILCVVFVNGITFLQVVVYNVVTPLIIFILRFRWKIYQINRSVDKEMAI